MPKQDIGQLQLAPRHLAMLQDILRQHVPASQVWAYGSRVTGKSHEGSDLDLVLRNTADLSARTPDWLDLQEAIRDSDLPFLVDVHDWASLPEAFHRNIERNYVEIQTV
ncbi:MAG: nucleotidyltransferase domain-containing protein [Lautropia sp.]|nr:nucleotidyltransferase domain-containing protein [Lautropia sp.]